MSRDLDKVINGAKNTVREAEAMEFPGPGHRRHGRPAGRGVRHLQAAFGALGRKATASPPRPPTRR